MEGIGVGMMVVVVLGLLPLIGFKTIGATTITANSTNAATNIAYVAWQVL